MLVKCDICGKMIDKKTAYRTEVPVNKRDGTIGSKKIKVCSESEWEQKLATDEIKFIVQEYVGKIEYQSVLTKEFKIWESWSTPVNILRCIKANQDKFNIMHHKTFQNEYFALRYFGAILKDNINNISVDVIVSMPEANETFVAYENKHNNKKKRKCLADYE